MRRCPDRQFNRNIHFVMPSRGKILIQFQIMQAGRRLRLRSSRASRFLSQQKWTLEQSRKEKLIPTQRKDDQSFMKIWLSLGRKSLIRHFTTLAVRVRQDQRQEEKPAGGGSEPESAAAVGDGGTGAAIKEHIMTLSSSISISDEELV